MNKELETVSIEDPRNYFDIWDSKTADEFSDAMQGWYDENGWELPSYENFADHYNETMEEING